MSVTVTGTGHGDSSFGVEIPANITAGRSGNITLLGVGSTNGSGNDYGVRVSGVVSAGGAVTITGTGGTGSNSFGFQMGQNDSIQAGSSILIKGVATDYGYGVRLSSPVTAGGSVTVTGTGNGNGSGDFGVQMPYSITAGNSGNITITGSASGSGSGNVYGVRLSGVVSAGGAVTITGTGGGSGNNTFGVQLGDSVHAGTNLVITGSGSSGGNGADSDYGVCLVAASAGGSVTITGTSQGTASGNTGVLVDGNVKSGASGNVTIRGLGSSNGYNDNYGVSISAAVSGGGSVTIIGTGNGTGSSNDGVSIKGSGAVVSTVNGALTISGSSGSPSGGSDQGVYIGSSGMVMTTGTGAITITGTAGQGTGSANAGVLLTGTGSNILAASGGITVNGIGRGTGSDAHGVAVEVGGLIQTSSTGSVSLTGQATSNVAALYFDTGHSSKLKVNTGSVILTGNQIDLGDANSISSTSTSGSCQLGFRSYTHGYGIVLGSASDVPNMLTLTSTDSAAIAQGGSNNGFGRITIGYANGGNPVSLGGPISFGTTVSLEAQGGMTLQIPDAVDYSSPEMSVTGQLYLNNDPLRLIAPTTAAVHGAHITMIHTTGGTVGTVFLNLPQGAVATDTLGHKYTIGYGGNAGGDVVLNAQ